MESIGLGSLQVSRFIIGSNPMSGFSHQSAEVDSRMRHYYTTSQIKRLLRDAESLGINTIIARADHHVMRLLMEYWDEGGTLQWIAQTCPELGSIERAIQNAITGGAKACYIHGGVMDHLLAHDQFDEAIKGVEMIRKAGMPVGVAGHNPKVFDWAESNLDLDFYMCCYYNPSSRANSPESGSGGSEWFDDKDRAIMLRTIAMLSKPVIHYKVMAAGRKTPEAGIGFAARQLREHDAVCVGIYDEQHPGMLREDVELFLKAVTARHP